MQLVDQGSPQHSTSLNPDHGTACPVCLPNLPPGAGTVLKRFDSGRLFALACSDAVELANLTAVLSFALVEEMAGSGREAPNPHLLEQVGRWVWV